MQNQRVAEFLETFDGDVNAAISAIRTYKSPAQPQRATLTQEVIISLDNITKTYIQNKHSTTVLKSITLDVYKGEFLAITGPSGSGKSTLMHLIGGLDKPTSGKLSVDGSDLSQLSDPQLSEFRNRTIGFVFQSFYLQPFLTLKDNIEVPAMFARASRLNRDRYADLFIKLIGLDDRSNYYPKQLSGGQLQRVAIARALLNRPKIILADEPTGNLDSKNSRTIIELFKRIQRHLGTTIILVTHDHKISASADRIITLNDGEIVK